MSARDKRRNYGPERRGLCRIKHDWFIYAMDYGGSLDRRCLRKGCPAQQHSRWYWDASKCWVWWPPYLWCGHGVNGVNLPACVRCANEQSEALR